MFLGSNSVRHLNAAVFSNWPYLAYLTLENIIVDDVAACLELIGKQLKENSIQFNKIYSSQWCRCYQTATLLDLGKVHEFAGLNSIFQNFVSRRETLQKLEQKLSEISLNKLVIFVTHQVNIQAITKKNVASGEMVAFNTSTKKSHKINLSVQ